MTNLAATPPASHKGELKGRHVLYWMLGFFGIMFAVNGVFLYHAITSFPGEDVAKSYVQGLNYNATLDQRAEQAALGWRAEIGLEAGQLILRLEDGSGAGLSGYLVEGHLRRRTSKQEDQNFRLLPQAAGEYVAKLDPLSSGQWESRLNIEDPATQDIIFTAHKTLFVR